MTNTHVINKKVSGQHKEVFILLFQVFDATNTTRERRGTIVKFAEQNGFKVCQQSFY